MVVVDGKQQKCDGGSGWKQKKCDGGDGGIGKKTIEIWKSKKGDG